MGYHLSKMENLTDEMQHIIHFLHFSENPQAALKHYIKKSNSHDHTTSPHPTCTTPLESLFSIYYQYILKQLKRNPKFFYLSQMHSVHLK